MSYVVTGTTTAEPSGAGAGLPTRENLQRSSAVIGRLPGFVAG